MENIKQARLLFEQSGTFKKEFEKLGYKAYDYDICNDFNETDYEVDLFKEIENAYSDKKSIFDTFDKQDCIMAFYPCIRFESLILLHFRGQAFGMDKWKEQDKIKRCMQLQDELSLYYTILYYVS